MSAPIERYDWIEGECFRGADGEWMRYEDHAAALSAAQARIAELEEERAAAGWRPIETAPKTGERVLLWSARWVAPNSGHFIHRGWEQSYELGPFLHQPTHWMPLPHPPRD